MVPKLLAACAAAALAACDTPPPPAPSVQVPTSWVRIDGKPANPRELEADKAICAGEAVGSIGPRAAYAQYGPPLIDFSPLANLGRTYEGAYDRARARAAAEDRQAIAVIGAIARMRACMARRGYVAG